MVLGRVEVAHFAKPGWCWLGKREILQSQQEFGAGLCSLPLSASGLEQQSVGLQMRAKQAVWTCVLPRSPNSSTDLSVEASAERCFHLNF